MNDFVISVTLDINCSKIPVIINSAQFDSGRILEVTVTANGNPFDINGCTAVFKGKRSNKTSFAVDSSISDNKVLINLDDAILSASGLIASKVVLSDGTRTYSTQILIIDTDSSLDGDLTSDNNFSILNKLINQIHALNESGGILIDDELDEESTNPLTNAKITAELSTIAKSITSLSHSKVNITDMNNLLGAKLSNKAGSVSTDHVSDGAITLEKLAEEVIALLGSGGSSEGGGISAETLTNMLKGYVTTADYTASLELKEDIENKVTSFELNFTDNDNKKYPTIIALINFLKNYYYDISDIDEMMESMKIDEDGNLSVTLPSWNGEAGETLVIGKVSSTPTDEQVKVAITSYLDEHPVQSGATSEQAEQIEKNTANIEKLSKKAGSSILGYAEGSEILINDAEGNSNITDLTIYGAENEIILTLENDTVQTVNISGLNCLPVLSNTAYKKDYDDFIADYIDLGNKNKVSKIESITLNGTESWTLNTQQPTDGYVAFQLLKDYIGMSKLSANTPMSMGGIQTKTLADWTGKLAENLICNSGSMIFIRISTEICTDLATWKAWLAENTPTLMFATAEYTTTPLDSELADSLSALQFSDSENTISINNGYIKLTYAKSLSKVLFEYEGFLKDTVVNNSRNLNDEVYERGGFNTSTGEELDNACMFRNKNYIPVIGGKSILLYAEMTNGYNIGAYSYIVEYDETLQPTVKKLTHKNKLTLQESTKYIRYFVNNNAEYYDEKFAKVCIVYADYFPVTTQFGYEPHYVPKYNPALMPTPKKVTIFGDSFSTYEGWIPEGYESWYKPSGNGNPENDVADVTQTWWYKLIKDNDLRLVVNSSWSGSTICNTGLTGAVSDYSFIKRMVNDLGEGRVTQEKPDLILIMCGVNDSLSGAELGELKYSDWTEEDLLKVFPATCYMLDYIKKFNPNAEIVVLANYKVSDAIKTGMQSACEYYDVDYCQLSNLVTNGGNAGGHPNITGMNILKHDVEAFLRRKQII